MRCNHYNWKIEGESLFSIIDGTMQYLLTCNKCKQMIWVLDINLDKYNISNKKEWIK